MSFLGFFFSWRGRIGRVSYLIGFIICSFIAYFCSRVDENGSPVVLVLAALFFLITLWSGWVIAVKRYHDVGKPGLLLAIPGICQIMAAIIMLSSGMVNKSGELQSGAGFMMFFIGIISCGLAIWSLCQGVVLLFFSGDVDNNDFGSPTPTLPSWLSGENDGMSIVPRPQAYNNKATDNRQSFGGRSPARQGFGKR